MISFLCLAFSILDLSSTTAARCLLLYFRRSLDLCLCLSYSACSRLELSRLWGRLYLVNYCWGFLRFRSFAGDQAFSIGNNIVNRQKGEFLAMTPPMAIAFLGLVFENNQLFATAMFSSSCQHHRIGYQGRSYHRITRIRDK